MPAAPSDLNDVASFGLTGQAGDVVFREGDAGADLFVVQKGRIELLKADANGGLHRIAACGVGDVFGERSLFDEAVRDVTARALTDFTALRIDRPTFDRITQEDPGIVRAMLARLASRPWDVEVAAAPAGVETAAASAPAKRAARTGGAPAPAAEGRDGACRTSRIASDSVALERDRAAGRGRALGRSARQRDQVHSRGRSDRYR